MNKLKTCLSFWKTFITFLFFDGAYSVKKSSLSIESKKEIIFDFKLFFCFFSISSIFISVSISFLKSKIPKKFFYK
jgi:hypothetical protein